MNHRLTVSTLVIGVVVCGAAPAAAALPTTNPKAIVDLTTDEGARQMKAVWRYRDVQIVDADFRAAGPKGQATGAKVRTYDIEPKAGPRDYDDSQWSTIAPATLKTRRGNGLLSMNWYRVRLTVPERIGRIKLAGKTLVFVTSVDDYAEVWVDGELPRQLAQSGGSVVKGWNADNGLVIGRDVRPGQEIQLAIFGVNGPLSRPPTNFIWMRTARVEIHPTKRRGPFAVPPHEVNIEVERLDPAMDALVGPNPKLFKLAQGFQFTEGPVWVSKGQYLLFSDPNANKIYKLRKGRLSVFRNRSGYSGRDVGEYRQPGSNGLTLDPQGRLTVDQHGHRRVVRLAANGRVEVVADRFEGRRFNSPNDLVFRSDGALFFTDPNFGLPKFGDDPRKELPFTGVFSLYRGKLTAVERALTGPNGIALSPDEKTLYVGNWDDNRKVVMRYDVTEDAQLTNGRVFFDMTSAPGAAAIDGVKVDVDGNVYVSGPGKLWILSKAGQHIGSILAPRHIHNMAWGEDGRTLFLCASDRVYKMRLNVEGVRPRGSR